MEITEAPPGIQTTQRISLGPSTATPEARSISERAPVERHVFETSNTAQPTETPFERVASALAAGVLLGDGLWIAIVTANRDSGLDLAVGLFTGTVLTLVGAVWLLYIIGRRQ